MADFNKNLDKMKDTVKATAQKAKKHEAVASVAQKLSDNQYVQTAQKHKHGKLILIGAGVLAILLLIGAFNLLFGNDNKAVIKYAEETIPTGIMFHHYDDAKLTSVKVVGSVKTDDKSVGSKYRYILDYTVTATEHDSNEKITVTCLALVQLKDDGDFIGLGPDGQWGGGTVYGEEYTESREDLLNRLKTSATNDGLFKLKE